jgi:UDP-N-acetylglucosamine 4,6-dehydratase/5-epimerase
MTEDSEVINQRSELFKNKTVLVTGGTGTIGSEIVRQLLIYHPNIIRVFSNDENGLFNLQRHFSSQESLRFLFGDVRDKDRLRMACENVDIVFHAAALKQVPICEYNPFEAVKTNVIGTQNLIETSLQENVESFTFISTDKAVNPSSTMGASKLLCEKLVAEAYSYKGNRRTKFSCVRFGNVLGSRGSVAEVFKHQIERGQSVTITNPEMTRFIMLLPQAVSLVFKATQLADNGETFILKMPSLKIIDMAKVMIELLSANSTQMRKKSELKIIGIRPGEKLHEELMTASEAKSSIELQDMFILFPKGRKTKISSDTQKSSLNGYFSSDGPFLTKTEIAELLKKAKII